MGEWIDIFSNYIAELPAFNSFLISLSSVICVFYINKINGDSDSIFITVIKAVVMIVFTVYALIWCYHVFSFFNNYGITNLEDKLLNIVSVIANIFGTIQAIQFVYNLIQGKEVKNDNEQEALDVKIDNCDDEHYKILTSLTQSEWNIVLQIAASETGRVDYFPNVNVIRVLSRKKVIYCPNPFNRIPVMDDYSRDVSKYKLSYALNNWVYDKLDEFYPGYNN